MLHIVRNLIQVIQKIFNAICEKQNYRYFKNAESNAKYSVILPKWSAE